MTFTKAVVGAVMVQGLALLRLSAAHAIVILTYTGNDFTTFTAPYTGTDKVTATLTLANPLGDNLNLEQVTPLSFTISDGVQSFNNITPSVRSNFQFSTTSTGLISMWSVGASAQFSSSRFRNILTQNISQPPPTGAVFDVAVSVPIPQVSEASNKNTPGTWTIATAGQRLSLLKTIPINGTAANRATQMFSFDISFVDNSNGLYYLADRSNAAIDVIDTTGAFTGTPDSLFGQIGGAAFGFAGDTGNPATSGPNGVMAAYPCIFVTDSNRVVSINAGISFITPVSSFDFGSTPANAKMAFDSDDRLLLVTYSGTPTSFVNEFAVSSTCQLNALPGIPFDSAHGVNATAGVGQPVWEPSTHRFYVSIPEVNGPGNGTGTAGAVAQIAPKGFAVVGPPPQPLTALYAINYCQPAGLTVGPNGNLLVGCNSVFDNSGKKCTAVVPSPNPAGTAAGAPATCTGGTAYPQVAICNPGQGCAGNSLQSVFGVGGGDEVWFNSGDGNYYVTAGNNPIGPTFGVVNSSTNTLTQLVPTLPPVPATNPATPPGHSAGTAHSIAASATNNHVYLPLPANNYYTAPPLGTPACVQGCIAVFGVQ